MPSGKPGSRMIRAAGGVAWRPGPGGEPEILLVHRKKYDDWSLPKGKTEAGETLPVTAVREVLEEGGARLALGRRLISVRYTVGGRPKRVHYWSAQVLSVDDRAVPNHEVDEVAWVPADRATERVSYAHDHGVLADFRARPAATVPLILLRHAKAVDKRGWKRPDAVRPLDDSGRADAQALASLLSCFAPRPRLISSTATRCLDTLRPLARQAGGQVHEEPSLYIHSNAAELDGTDPAAAASALVRDVIAAGEPAVVCAHRENIPFLRTAALAALAGHPGGPAVPGDDGADIPRDVAELPRDWDDPLPTGGFWVLNIAPLPPAAGPPDPVRPGERAPLGAGAPPGAGLVPPGNGGSPGQALPSPDTVQPADTARLAAAARRWWQPGWRRPDRRNALTVPASGTRPGYPARRGTTPGDTLDGPARTVRPAGGREPEPGDGPLGLLVSADRYDLSES
jgi:8-oxo-dGTP pyrophosphatase MutT (NUDIX family)/phosphohistidine phosphatase SixA